MTSSELCALINDTLIDHKAMDIKIIDVSHLTTITDNMIICTASSSRHAKTLADKICVACKKADHRPFGVEGQETGEWVLIDLSEVVVHIMLAETREFYSLEKLWALTQATREKSA